MLQEKRQMLLNLLYERTLGKPTIGQLANNQQREFKFPNEGFFPNDTWKVSK